MDKRRIRKSFSRIGWAMAALLIISQGLSTVILLAGSALFPSLFKSYESSMVVLDLVQAGVGLPVVLLILRPLPGHAPRQRIAYPPRMLAALVVVCLGATYLANLGTLLLFQLLELVLGRSFLNPLDMVVEGMNPVATLLFTVIIAPLLEELIFRGILLDRLRPWGDRVCILASALFFALYHCNLYQFFYAFCLGAIFAYVALRTGGIRLPVFLHTVVNLLGAVVLPALSQSASSLALGLVGMGVLLLIGGTVVLFFHLRHTVVLLPGPAPFTEAQKSRLLLGNAGFVVYFVLCTGLTLVTLLL